jgi:hypothetical protein
MTSHSFTTRSASASPTACLFLSPCSLYVSVAGRYHRCCGQVLQACQGTSALHESRHQGTDLACDVSGPVPTHSAAYLQVLTHSYTYRLTHAYTSLHILQHACTFWHTLTHTLHILIHTLTLLTHAYTHAHTRLHMLVHTLTHAYTCLYTFTHA